MDVHYSFASARYNYWPASNSSFREASGYSEMEYPGRFTTRQFWQRRNQPKDEDENEITLLRSVVNYELTAIERVCQRVVALTQSLAHSPPVRGCFLKEGSHFGLMALAKTLVRETNLRVKDCGMDKESTGLVCCVLAVEYISRVHRRIPPFYLQTLFLSAFILAFKVIEDDSLPNSFFGSIAGFSLQDVNDMESEFCQMLSWNLGISLSRYRFHRENLLLC